MTVDAPTLVDAAASTGASADDESQPRVEVFGIRHHGPGSARSLLASLEELQPDAVLVEGPADADPLIALSVADGMAPPVALLAYAADEPSRAAFWPYAVFSPEWQAITWAVDRGVHVAFCDLPASLTLASLRPKHRGQQGGDEAGAHAPDPAQAGDPGDGGADPGQPDVEGVDLAQPDLSGVDPARATTAEVRRDPLALLAGAAGYDDPERWWDDVVESRRDGSSPFSALTEAMAVLREDLAGDAEEEKQAEEERREAYMRQVIRATLKSGYRRVAVVCGAWHAPALTYPLPPAAADSRVLKGLPKRKVSLTWVPWTHSRLAYDSGYAAGVTSPGWYHHLWTVPDRPVVRWLTKVARSLRERDLLVSSAHLIDAVRLAESLAVLRNRPLAGLAEVTEATRAVLCEGDEVAVRFVTDHLVVGQALGSVPDTVPTVPLEADLAARCRSLRLKRESQSRTLDLDLRKANDQERSRLFHRLRLLDIDWAVPAASQVRSTGTFRETWQLEWAPEFAVAIVEAAVWGTTVEAAATAKVVDRAPAASLAELTVTVEGCLLADLPDAVRVLLQALEAKAALDVDVHHLMAALPALVRAQRYGDVRETDTSALAEVTRSMLVRICSSLPQAVASLDDDGALALRALVDKVHAAVLLLPAEEPSTVSRDRWLDTLRSLVDRADVNGLLLGRMVRLLHDASVLDDVPRRVERALSVGVPAAQKAGWVDGFFADGALLLVHDTELLGLLDAWVCGLDPQQFLDVLPLVRRTFGSFEPAERRSIAGRVRAGRRAAAEPVGTSLDAERGRAALATVELILGVSR